MSEYNRLLKQSDFSVRTYKFAKTGDLVIEIEGSESDQKLVLSGERAVGLLATVEKYLDEIQE